MGKLCTPRDVTVNRQMSKEIEDRLRARYTLVDKTDPAAILAAQQAGLPIGDDGEVMTMVGEVDTTKGFSVGPTVSSSQAAVPSSVVSARKKDAARKGRAKDRTRYAAPVSTDRNSNSGLAKCREIMPAWFCPHCPISSPGF